MFLKIISVRFMDKNLVKYVINGANLVKIGNFWWKWSNLGHFGDQNDVIDPPFKEGRKYFFRKSVSKVISVRFKPELKNFYKLVEEKFVSHFPQILTYDVIFPPKWLDFAHFYQKWPILTKLTPLMTFLTKSSSS